MTGQIAPPPQADSLLNRLIDVQADDPVQRQRGRLANAILLITGGSVLVAFVVATTIGLVSPLYAPDPLVQNSALVVVALSVGMYALNKKRGYTSLAGVLFAAILMMLDIVVFVAPNPLSPAAVSMAGPLLIAALIGPPISALGIAALASGLYLALVTRYSPTYWIGLLGDGPERSSLVVYLTLFFLAFIAWPFSRLANRMLRESVEVAEALSTNQEDLQARLEAQTRVLRATTSIARAVSDLRDLDRLLSDVVGLVRDFFGYAYVQVYLLDELGQHAELRQSSSQAGLKLLASGHSLPVGGRSAVGQVTASGKALVVRGADAEAKQYLDALLPSARARMIVPLAVGQRVIGALELQSVDSDAFDDEIVPALQALADQIAIAAENARLFEQAEQNLLELDQLSRRATQRSWHDYLALTDEEERSYTCGPLSEADRKQRAEVIERVRSTRAVLASDGGPDRPACLAAPVVVRDRVIGVLGVEADTPRQWSRDDVLLIQSLAERTGLAVENARLVRQAQHAAQREQTINAITARLQRAPNLRALLESATDELSKALRTSEVYAEIAARPTEPPTEVEGPPEIEADVPAQPEADVPAQPEEERTGL
jgi:GAF domain-containing protein